MGKLWMNNGKTELENKLYDLFPPVHVGDDCDNDGDNIGDDDAA